MKLIIRVLIIFCANRALRLEQMKDMFIAQENSLKYIYATGTIILCRDKWLKRIVWLEKRIH